MTHLQVESSQGYYFEN